MSQSSFLPEDYVAQQAERRTSVLGMALFVVVMTAVVGAFFVTNRQWSQVKLEQQRINVAYTEKAKLIDQLNELEQQKRQILEKAEVTAALVERVPRSVLLAEIINRMPDRVSLQEFELKSIRVRTAPPPKDKATQVKSLTNGKMPTKAEAAEERKIEVPKFSVSVELIGIAPSDGLLSDYLTSLGQSDLFAMVDLSYSREFVIEESVFRKFSVRMTLNEDADVKQFEPMKMRRLEHDLMDPLPATIPGPDDELDPESTRVDYGAGEFGNDGNAGNGKSGGR